MESVSGVLPIIGGIITATATLDLMIGDSPEDTITGSFAVDANLPNFTLANLTFGARAESDNIVVTEHGQQLSIQCFDIFQRIGLAGPGIEFFRPLAVVRLGNQVYTMNSYEETPDNISFDFSTGAAVPIRGTIDLFSGIGAGVPCLNGVPEGDGSSSSATFNAGGCVDTRGVDSNGVAFGFSTFRGASPGSSVMVAAREGQAALLRRARSQGPWTAIQAVTCSPPRTPTFEATAPRATTRTPPTGTKATW
jgi:hypothetical protein